MEDPVLDLDHFSLDNLTTVSLNTDALRTNFEIILDFMRKLKSQFNAQSKNFNDLKDGYEKDIRDLQDKLNQVDKREKDNKASTDHSLNDHSKELKELREKCNKLDNRVDNHDSDIQKLRDELDKLKQRVDANANANNNSSSDTVDKSALNDINDQIKDLYDKLNNMVTKDMLSEYATLVYVDQTKADLNKRIDDLLKMLRDFQHDTNEKLSDLASQKDVDELKKLLELLQNDTVKTDDLNALISQLRDEIKNKVDCDAFDEHVSNYTTNINNLYALLSQKGDGSENKVVIQQPVQTGTTLSTKDANLLKELEKKFPELEALIRKLQKEFSEHQIKYKSFSDDASKRLDTQEVFKTDASKRITNLEDALKELRAFVEANAGSGGSGGASKGGSGEGDASLKFEIQRILGRLTVMNDTLEKHDRDIQSSDKNISNLDSRVGSLENRMTAVENRLAALEDDVNDLKSLRSKLDMLEIAISDLRTRSKTSKSNSVDMNAGGINIEVVRQMIDEAINGLRDELLALIDELRELISKKADYDDLVKSETTLLEKLDQVAGALLKRCADKNDTKKALLFLEKKIKEISIIIFGDPNQGEEGAILAKKPYTPWSCVSCDSRLNKYPGGLIDHKNWSKFPPNDSSPDKMTQGKFGKGWSKYADGRKTGSNFGGGSMRDSGYKTIDVLPDINAPQHQHSNESRGEDRFP